jgi:hypothetical protein
MKLNQEENYGAIFGSVFRSSAIFYKPKDVQTTISFSNYWEFKNNIQIGLVISIRSLKGKIISRKELNFSKKDVICIDINEVNEGSIEIEAFSNKNLRIPYSAIMGVYETENSVSMVHTYARNHSLIELEDDFAITEGRESCWTLKPFSNITNHAVFHNGHVSLKPQQGIFLITRKDGVEKKVIFDIPSLKAFETFKFDAEKIFPKLHEFLDNQIGWGTLHFESHSSFTRLLIMWKNAKTNEVQVTHSNFDYIAHTTNINKTIKPAYMKLPVIYGALPNVIVYPKFTIGKYIVSGNQDISNGAIFKSDSEEITFSRADNYLPSRIVTAITGNLTKDTSLPFECSLGVFHEKRPPKRFHWFLISSVMQTVIHITFYEEIYKNIEPIDLIFKLYSDISKNVSEVTLSFESFNEIPKELKLSDIFDLSGIKKFGYVSIFSHYGGFLIYSSLKKNNVITLEHSF